MRRALTPLLLLATLAGGAADATQSERPAGQAAEATSVTTRSPNARPERVQRMSRALAAPASAADGTGRAWIGGSRGQRARATVREERSWRIVYEAVGRGVARGGSVEVLVPPFLGWSAPQLHNPKARGYVEVTTSAPLVRLRPRILERWRIQVRVDGRSLRAGERVEIVYGAGEAGARADSSAERESRFWIFVDGDGDDVARFLPGSPVVDIEPGPAARLHLAWPATARPGETVRLRVSVLDARGNAGVPWSGSIRLTDLAPGIEGPQTLSLDAADRGLGTLSFVVRDEGRYRVGAEGPGGLRGRSQPLRVRAGARRVLWGDLHGHSNLSDGTGTPEDFFRYARDVAGLDVAALTDHDTHGAPRYLSEHPEVWERIAEQVQRFEKPGRFVALLGYEWTSWIQGHRHVLYFAHAGEVLSALDPRYQSPPGLWRGLRALCGPRGLDCLTVGHHPAGGPIALNWDFAPDPDFEPVVEIVSEHGSSEAPDSPLPMRTGFAGHFARDALDRGHRLGFIGSSDSHDGRPGCVDRGPDQACGLAGILSETRTRAGVIEALRARRVYATSGPRILLWLELDGQPMGSSLAAAPSRELAVEVDGTAAVARVEIVRSGEVVESVAGGGREEMAFGRRLEGLRSREYVYVRAVQQDGAVAWSSPFFIE